MLCYIKYETCSCFWEYFFDQGFLTFTCHLHNNGRVVIICMIAFDFENAAYFWEENCVLKVQTYIYEAVYFVVWGSLSEENEEE